jgi:hypothetical protein
VGKFTPRFLVLLLRRNLRAIASRFEVSSARAERANNNPIRCVDAVSAFPPLSREIRFATSAARLPHKIVIE